MQQIKTKNSTIPAWLRLVRGLMLLSLGLLLARPTSSSASNVLTPVTPRAVRGGVGSDLLGTDEQIFDRQVWGITQSGDKAALLTAIDNSLQYLQTGQAMTAYRNYPIAGITRDRVQRSLKRFREVVITSRSSQELQAVVQREFLYYQTVGRDNQGTVAFTGYFEPTYQASRVPTAEFRYPLFRLPPNFPQWARPHPTRLQLEGPDGLQGNKGKLRGLEFVWLRDRLEAFLIHVQGSARLQLANGNEMTVGYAGKTDHPYTGIGRELVKEGKLQLAELTLPAVIAYFRATPTEMNRYLPRNRSFVFFRETNGVLPTGSLGVPVTAERSIATDKSLMPPGALALIWTTIPTVNSGGKLEQTKVSRYVLDQDTGSAIKGPGRVDIFMGTGNQAGDRAGLLNSTGQLYYLLLK